MSGWYVWLVGGWTKGTGPNTRLLCEVVSLDLVVRGCTVRTPVAMLTQFPPSRRETVDHP